MREAIGKAAAGTAAPGGAPPLDAGIREAVAAFRLNGMYAEIRSGEGASHVLASVPGAGIPEGGRLFDEATWALAARSPGPRVFPLPEGRRAVTRSLRLDEAQTRLTIAVADRTTLVEATLSSIRASLIELGAAGLLLAVVGGYWLATRALQPIDLLTRQAGAMAATAVAASGGARLAIPNPDDELGRLGLTFNRLLERLEASATQTRTFVADAAHELKTPVAIVRTEAELALPGERSPEERREALAAIAAESIHLSRLVSDLTLLAEGELLEHPQERRLVDLSELAHDVVRSLRSLASGRGSTVDVDAPAGLEYRGDERLLRQVLVNLVENAIKFSPSGARIGVVLSREPAGVELRVLDEAATLAAEERERVFQRFYRSPDARGAGTAGSGLGLSIARWAVGLHGGRLRVEPRVPRGNVFVAELPIGAGGEARAAAQ